MHTESSLYRLPSNPRHPYKLRAIFHRSYIPDLLKGTKLINPGTAGKGVLRELIIFQKKGSEGADFKRVMERAAAAFEDDLNLKATELRLGLPGRDETEQGSSSGVKNNKRSSPEMERKREQQESCGVSAPKAQVVGWPPVRSHRKNALQQQKKPESEGSGMFVKVSMDGAPYLRKIDLKFYDNYFDLLRALENMFKCTIGVYSEREGYNGSEHAPTYEDKDGDWMLVGDVPWDMFSTSCKRLRIMKGSEAKGLGCI